MPDLFDPIEVRGLRVRNRLWVAPMCQYSVEDRDGIPTDWHLVHLGSFARGGAGLVMAEASAVVPEGRISLHDTGIWNDDQTSAWRRVVEFVHGQGAAIGIQLAHAGRKASVFPEWGYAERGDLPIGDGGWQTVSASPVPYDGSRTPRVLRIDEIAAIVAAFAQGAERAIRAGFDLVEIHAAHGYLIHQFLSPISNRRDDAYGGSLENRSRLLLDVVRAVRQAIGDGPPILVRFSATDYVPGGWDEEQTATAARWARDAGADFFDISSGGLVPHARISVGPGYQARFAGYVRRTAGVPVNAVGMIWTPRLANELVADEVVDAVMVGRQMLRDPHFAARAASELGAPTAYWPPQYRPGVHSQA
jgi:2,4-dienoyl-CoA reductase-like NADH-dependent reductase (Old Yellow Enzyme family)